MPALKVYRVRKHLSIYHVLAGHNGQYREGDSSYALNLVG
jgi:hypothetical protein